MATDTVQANAQISTSMVVAITSTLSSVVIVPINHGEKPEKFSGAEFIRCQQKMMFYLTTLNLTRFLRETAPTLNEDEIDRQVVTVGDA